MTWDVQHGLGVCLERVPAVVIAISAVAAHCGDPSVDPSPASNALCRVEGGAGVDARDLGDDRDRRRGTT
jgi:hypothetical protein